MSSKPDPYPTPVDVVVYLISAIMNRVIKRFYCILNYSHSGVISILCCQPIREPQQYGRHYAEIFSNAFPWKQFFVFWFKFYWSLCLIVQLQKVSNGSGNGLAQHRWQAITWTKDDSIRWRIYASPSISDLKKKMQSPERNAYSILKWSSFHNRAIGDHYPNGINVCCVLSYFIQY